MIVEVNGVLAQVADAGRGLDPQRRSVIWLHGAGMDRTVWMLQARDRAFAAMNSLAVDLPEHGGSGGVALADVGALATWVLDLLTALGLESAMLVGHSMGALIALEAAGRAPARVERLALLGAAATMPVHPDLLRAAQANEPVAADLIAAWGIGRSNRMAARHTPGVALGATARALLLSARPGVLGVDLAACNAYRNAAEAAAKIACPTLVLSGSEDRMASARRGAELAALIPAARFERLEQAGHMMMLEQPEASLQALAALFA